MKKRSALVVRTELQLCQKGRGGGAPRFAIFATLAITIFLALATLTPGTTPRATAQDAQTDAMIWHFNVYRVQHGLPPLYTHPDMSALLQSNAEQSAAACGPIIPAKPSYAHKWTFFAENGGETADIRWNYDWSMDPNITSRLEDADFNSVGVGRALSECSQGWTWTAALAEVDGVPAGPQPTPTGPVASTPAPPTATSPNATSTPVATPTPTATPVVTPAPTPTLVTTTATPTEGPTASVALTVSPTRAPSSTTTTINGDANCDHNVTQLDGMLILFLAADFAANTPCLGPKGVDCTALVDALDALAIFRYLANLNPNIPFDCPPIGIAPTPGSTATATVTPGPTETPDATPTEAPSTTATTAPTFAPDEIGYCFLALASYEVAFAPAFNGTVTCDAGEGGADYSCDFPGDQNSFTCESSSPRMPDRDCYVLDTTWAYCGVAPGQQGTAYQCNNNQGVSECLPVDDPDSPIYTCTPEETGISCFTDRESFPHFWCSGSDQEYVCNVLLAD